MHPFTFIMTIFLTVITCDQVYTLAPDENGLGGIWLYEKRSDDENEAVRSVRSPLGTMRFGKRAVVPLGTMRFGKRSDLDHFLDTLALAHQDDDRGSIADGSSGYPTIYSKASYLGPYAKRNSPLGTMRFG